MSKQVRRASAIAVAAMIVSIVAGANGSGASAQSPGAVIQSEPASQTISVPVVQALPAPATTPAVETDETLDSSAPIRASTLSALVSAQPQPGELSRELHCLAGAIYFEAKSESLTGQLAVGRVIVARSKSGRFPNSYCGVVFQRSQFSFVRGGSMPTIARKSAQWRNAVAIAQIAHAGSWKSPTEGALFFHATYVSPGWHLKRIARIDGHIFYR